MEQRWFEFSKERSRKLDNKIWVPLKSQHLISEGRKCFNGFKESFENIDTYITETANKSALGCSDFKRIDKPWGDSGHCDDDSYISSDVFLDKSNGVNGIKLVLEQSLSSNQPNKWHLHQDLILTLDLEKSGNEWRCPKQGNELVARISFNDKSEPVKLEINSVYLKDYLCAQGMLLFINSYRERIAITDDASFIDWNDQNEYGIEAYKQYENEAYKWEGFVNAIHEGTVDAHGEKIFISHTSREDIDISDDFPSIAKPADDHNIRRYHHTMKPSGRKLFQVNGRLYEKEYILPADSSRKVRGDQLSSASTFIIDVKGDSGSSDDPDNQGIWLWFRPELINNLFERTNCKLMFYTRKTGGIECEYGNGKYINFGLNSKGLINILIDDLNGTPEWQKKIWSASNIYPEGEVCKELLQSQVHAKPASTIAPESELFFVIRGLNKSFKSKFGVDLYKHHPQNDELKTKCHRFRSINESSLLALAKDLYKLVFENIIDDNLKKACEPLGEKEKNWRSIKLIECLLNKYCKVDDAKKVTASFAGLYDLRNSESHLKSTDKTNKGYELLEIVKSDPYVIQGETMLFNIVRSLFKVSQLIEDEMHIWSGDAILR